MKTTLAITAGLAIIASVFALASAQQQDIQRTNLMRNDLSVPGREVIQVKVDFAPGASFPKHKHPGEEVAYVLEGTLEYRLEGRPAVTLEAGDALFIPAGTVHEAANVGSGNGSELATYIVEKGEPLVVLAP
jgi:quercetin dioxygenase-like cupin family protein